MEPRRISQASLFRSLAAMYFAVISEAEPSSPCHR